MPRIPISVLPVLLLLISLPASAQEPVVEYGAPAELRSVSKIFIDTGMDIRQREQIIKEIRKTLPGLTVVSRPEDSDIHLRFMLTDKNTGHNAVYPYPYPPPASGGVAVGIPGIDITWREGVGTVLRRVGAGRVRVLLSFRDARGNRFERKPSTNFAREFVKAYKKANR
jgi:hypothetical protein